MSKPNLTRRALVTALAGVALTASLGVLAQGFQVHYRVAGIVPPPKTLAAHTFTDCGQTGRFGPTLSQCESAYSGSDMLKAPHGFSVSNGIQSWTVPEDGTYTFEIAAPSLHDATTIGPGSIITSTVKLNRGEVVNVVVGQRGVGGWPVAEGSQPNNNDGLGGPGGSFVYTGNIGGAGLIGAAGGGNVNCTPTSLDSCTGGTNNGHHGRVIHTASYYSAPGAGWLSSAGKLATGVQGGLHFTGGNDASCSNWGSCHLQPGGFGGGGGSHNDNIGGSGGYTGGANSANNAYSNEGYPGGSSPVSATRSLSVVFKGTNNGEGYVKVSRQ